MSKSGKCPNCGVDHSLHDNRTFCLSGDVINHLTRQLAQEKARSKFLTGLVHDAYREGWDDAIVETIEGESPNHQDYLEAWQESDAAKAAKEADDGKPE